MGYVIVKAQLPWIYGNVNQRAINALGLGWFTALQTITYTAKNSLLVTNCTRIVTSGDVQLVT